MVSGLFGVKESETKEDVERTLRSQENSVFRLRFSN